MINLLAQAAVWTLQCSIYEAFRLDYCTFPQLDKFRPHRLVQRGGEAL